MGSKNKRTRKQSTTLTMTVQSSYTGQCFLEGNIQNGTVTIRDENGVLLPVSNLILTQSRERTSSPRKGDKVTCEIPCTTLTLQPDSALLCYDEIFAVDTNTKFVNGEWLSAGSLVRLLGFRGESGVAEVEAMVYITSVNSFQRAQMEQHVWNAAIDVIGKIAPGAKNIALIADCDLGNLEHYNKRTLKICDKDLPDNITLVYASADHTNSIASRVIRLCDGYASEWLAQLAEERKTGHDQL